MREEIKKAVDILKQGGLIIYPTDTVWGIGCDATNQEAVAKIYALKKRTDSKSMLVLLDNADKIGKYVREIPEIAFDLLEVADKPMTIIYPQAINLAPSLIAEDGSIGIRVVNHEFCQQLIRLFNRPLVSTSVNISGEKAPATYAEINKDILSAVDLVINPKYASKTKNKPSSIIKIGLRNEIEIIRA